MNRIAIVTDSNSGITQKEAEAMGVYVVPTPFSIDGQDYFEDINLTQEDFYGKLKDDAAIFTSQPSPDSVMTLWDKLLGEYDQIVHIPLSSGLSNACQTAIMLSQDYDGKVSVVNNQRVSVTQRQSVLDALELAKCGKNCEEIKDILEDDKFNSSIYIMLDTLYYLKKGGRITPAAAALGALLRLKPVLQIQGEKLDAFAKARTSGQGKNIMMTAIDNDIKNRFGGDYNDIHFAVAHTQNDEAAAMLAEELKAAYPGISVVINPLSLSVSCHIGPGALAIAICKKMKYETM